MRGWCLILVNVSSLPDALAEIVRCDFTPTALAGGAVGSMFMCIKNGVARGITPMSLVSVLQLWFTVVRK